MFDSSITLSIVLTLTLAAAPQGGGGRPRRPEPRTSSCATGSVQCLFGEAAGCRVDCPEPLVPCCLRALCFQGWPVPAKCNCTLGTHG